jgi:hypothetical protein
MFCCHDEALPIDWIVEDEEHCCVAESLCELDRCAVVSVEGFVGIAVSDEKLGVSDLVLTDGEVECTLALELGVLVGVVLEQPKQHLRRCMLDRKEDRRVSVHVGFIEVAAVVEKKLEDRREAVLDRKMHRIVIAVPERIRVRAPLQKKLDNILLLERRRQLK